LQPLLHFSSIIPCLCTLLCTDSLYKEKRSKGVTWPGDGLLVGSGSNEKCWLSTLEVPFLMVELNFLIAGLNSLFSMVRLDFLITRLNFPFLILGLDFLIAGLKMKILDNKVKFEILDDMVELDFLIAELIFLVFLDCRVGLPDDKVSILCIMNQ